MLKESTDELNRQMPRLVQEAFTQAYQRACESGLPFMAAIDGYLCEVQPDGSHKKVRKLEERVKVNTKKIYTL